MSLGRAPNLSLNSTFVVLAPLAEEDEAVVVDDDEGVEVVAAWLGAGAGLGESAVVWVKGLTSFTSCRYPRMPLNSSMRVSSSFLTLGMPWLATSCRMVCL